MKSVCVVLALAAVVAGCRCGLMCGSQASADVKEPHGLTVEYMIDPVGLETQSPRLSWKLQAADPAARGLSQTGYHILVATSADRLRRDEGDLWDSGKVVSHQSLNVAYKGRPLKTSQHCYWKVRVWDNRGGGASAWSGAARWVMGVTRPEDWQAAWIGANAVTRPDFDLRGAQWIWAGDAKSPEKAAAGKRYFRKVFEAPQGADGKPVTLALTADDEYDVFINGECAAKTWGHLNDWRWMRFVDVSKNIRPGQNLVAVEVRNNKPGPTGLLALLEFADGQTVATDNSWTAAAVASEGWNNKLEGFEAKEWRKAAVAGAPDCQPWGKIERRQETVSPAFEKRFKAAKRVRQATLHITAPGYYEASLNGTRVGNKVLDPSPTKFDKRVLYSTYDVSDMVKRGENSIKVLLGHGWYDVRSVAVWNFDNAPWRDFPRMIAQLEMVYSDGTRETVVSDSTWRQVASPVGFDCIREGEVIGMAPAAVPDLAKTEIMAEIVTAPAGRLTAAAMPPSVIAQELKPVAVRALREGVWMVDFGQNTAGWIRLKITGQSAGDVVTVRYGEKINEDGTLSLKGTEEHFRYPASFRVLPGGWFQVDRFVCDGSREQVYEPRFTYSGFQYAEIHGLKQAPTAETVVACVIHTDFKRAGAFESENDLLNKLQEAVLWAYMSNFVNGYPMDCPHREKNGWTGDALLASELAMYNFQNVAAYNKWIADIMDEQRADGNVAAIIPTSGWGYEWGNGPAWDSALVVIPWMLYVYRGDLRALETAYPAMVKYVDYMTSRRTAEGLLKHGLGDWIPVASKTPVEVTSTGYHYLDAQIVARVAELLGHPEDAKRFAELAASIREAFNERLYKGDGVYSIGSQTAQSCALHQGLAPDAERAKIEARLVESVQKTGVMPDFGILGSKYIFRSLSEAGRSDLAFKMLCQDAHPSFGNWIKRGATTLWEDWNEGDSRNHVMFGDFSAWCYQYLGGIRLDANVSTIAQKVDPRAVAFKSFIIRPDPVEGLRWFKAEHDSAYGMIRSTWQKESERFVLEVEVPVNTTATVYLPVEPGAEGVETDVEPTATDGDRMAFKVGSGRYRFSAPISRLSSPRH